MQRGFELLRDRGLSYNPDDVSICFQLGWIFQHKMGQNLDDGNRYYKLQWLADMAPFFGPHGTNFDNLIHPQTAEARTNSLVLRDKYKIDPVFAQKVDAQYGPLDWRLPEAHAIYWYALGLEKAAGNTNKVKQGDFDLMQLRRGIFQSEQAAFRHGRVIANPFARSGVELAPNLDLIPKANDSYLQMYAEEKDDGQRTDILRAHRNFVRDAVYFLYQNDRMAEAAKWFKYLGEKYPDQTIIEDRPDSLPKNVTLDEYAVAVTQIDIDETSQERVNSAVRGLLVHAYLDTAIGEEDRAAGFQLLAAKVNASYRARMGKDQPRAALDSLNDLKRDVLTELLDPQNGLPYNARTIIRSQVGMPAETNAPPQTVSTNAMAPVVPPPSTNSPATNPATK